MGERPMPYVAGVHHRFVEANGVRFHVAEAGEGEPVLFLHGYPQHWYAWRHLVPLLRGRHRLIMPDLRGFGWTDAPLRGYGTGARVDDVLALMDALGLERAALVGHEWGAWAGFMACLRAPERFTRYLALNMSHPWPDRRALRRTAWRMWHTAFLEYPLAGAAVVRYWPGFSRWLLRRGVTDRSVWTRPVLDEFAESIRPPARAHASRALHWQYVLRDIPKLSSGRFRRERLTVPTMILFGEDDFALSPRVLPGGERHADDLRVRLIPGCGHYIADERPDLVAAAALEFLPDDR
ncbi:alpha/beta fold hydrolase [Actinomadura macrotermitis]|uniref:Soluble epoxide hydrolase n=1 Tax=Actinomadura macrotermitis TaxID=2585200 RepID=A0A7K0BWV8_9ACTN|nr:alpha/beta hydrolase [Actinomadura macrotermitis]MQY05556.1 Soluble epoxide hydrolase [Actinomadura macrotermitis]